MQAVFCLPQLEGRAPSGDRQAVVHKHLEKRLETKRARLSFYQTHVVDSKGIFHRSEPVQFFQNGFRVEPILNPNDQSQTVLAVGVVIDRRDSGQTFGLNLVLDLLNDLFRAHQVRKLRDHDAFAPG